MEKEETRKMVKPIIPRNTLIQTGESYQIFKKKGYRVLPKLEIDKAATRYDNRYNTDDQAAKLLKLFKTLKYVPSLDLSQLLMTTRTFFLPRALYFIKKMSKAHIALVYDVKMAEENYQGISDAWLRKAQQLKVFGYAFDYRKKLGSRTVNDENTPKNFAAVIHRLKYQNRIKEFHLKVPSGSGSFSDYFWNFEKYPSTIEKLSLQQINSYKPLNRDSPSSMAHLKNLRHLELTFSSQSSNEFITSVFQLLPAISSHLLSLSLSWPSNYFNPELQGLKALKQIKRLKLDLHFTDLHHIDQLLAVFSDLQLEHLIFIAQIESEELLTSIAAFLGKFIKTLDHLELRVTNEQSFTRIYHTQEILGIVNNLSLLKTLSVSITSLDFENNYFPIELNSIMTKIFTKPIPLESFEIRLQSASLSDQEFLQLFKCLQTINSNFKRLQIHIGGGNKLIKLEDLNFLKNLKNLRTLGLEILNIPNDKLLLTILDILNHLPFLEYLALGEVKEDVTPELFKTSMEQILSKRGLQEISCGSSRDFREKLMLTKEDCTDLDLQRIKRKNPLLKTKPELSIYKQNSLPAWKLNLW